MAKKIMIVLFIFVLALVIFIAGYYLINPMNIQSNVEVGINKEYSPVKVVLPTNHYKKAKKENKSLYEHMTDTYTEEELFSIIIQSNPELAQEIDTQYDISYIPSQDALAIFDIANAEYFTYVEEIEGLELDKQNIYLGVLQAMSGATNKVEYSYKNIAPNITYEQLRSNTKLMAQYETNFSFGSENRTANIKLAGDRINGIVLAPNEQFSFNNVVGFRTETNGYKMAPVIEFGKFIQGLGGGVCQVSTTLYNTVIRAGLEVIYASQHSLPVSYVPASLDAMVSELNDFVFSNNTDSNIYIVSKTDSCKLYFEIYGKASEYQILPTSEVLRNIVADNEIKLDTSLVSSEIIVDKIPKDGLVSKSYLEYYTNDLLVKRELLRQNTYKAQSGCTRMGIDAYNYYINQNLIEDIAS